MSNATHAYIARTKTSNKRWPAGTVAAAVVDSPDQRKMVSDAVAEWLQDDCIVERVPIPWVRKFLFTTQMYSEDAVAA